MIIVTLIAMALCALVIYKGFVWFNGYTKEYANYEFFTIDHTIAFGAAYALIFLGANWMHRSEDWLNGAILLVIGIGVLVKVLINNFIHTPRLFAIAGSLAQIIFYIPIVLCSVIIIAFMMAFGAQVKPVYTLNSRD